MNVPRPRSDDLDDWWSRTGGAMVGGGAGSSQFALTDQEWDELIAEAEERAARRQPVGFAPPGLPFPKKARRRRRR